MAYSNEGIGYQDAFYPRMAGQDQRYFPLGTSTARPAKDYGVDPHWRTDAQKFEDGLTKLLGSRKKARLYMAQTAP
jgi:hypothetical protein